MHFQTLAFRSNQSKRNSQNVVHLGIFFFLSFFLHQAIHVSYYRFENMPGQLWLWSRQSFRQWPNMNSNNFSKLKSKMKSKTENIRCWRTVFNSYIIWDSIYLYFLPFCCRGHCCMKNNTSHNCLQWNNANFPCTSL